MVMALANEWSYVTGAYGAVFGLISAYTIWVLRRGRKAGVQLPPDERRWM